MAALVIGIPGGLVSILAIVFGISTGYRLVGVGGLVVVIGLTRAFWPR